MNNISAKILLLHVHPIPGAQAKFTRARLTLGQVRNMLEPV